MAVGFFDTFFDNDLRQRSDLNDLQTRADQLSIELTHDIRSVRVYAAKLEKQVHDLSLVVAVMMKMLEDSGHLDTKVLRYRLEAEHEAINEAIQEARAQALRSTSEPPVAEAPPPSTPTQCGRCGATVPAHQTGITADGVVCDTCGTK